MQLLKIRAVAERLNCSDSFVRSLIAQGRLRFHRLGKGQGGIRVSEEQLAAYLQATEQGGTDATPAPPPAPKMQRHVLMHLTLD